MATLREMRERVLDGSKRAGLTDTTEIDKLVNQTYLEMSALTRPNIATSVQALTLGVADYSIVTDWTLSDVQSIRDLTITDPSSSQTLWLERVSPQRIHMLRQTQATSGGSMSLYAIEGLDTVRFYAAPSTTTVSVTVEYDQRPAILVLDADTPVGIPLEFHDVIVLGAIARAVRIWNPNYARDYHEYYRLGIREYRQWLNRYGGSWNAKVIVKGSRSNTAYHDNSTYYSGMR